MPKKQAVKKDVVSMAKEIFGYPNGLERQDEFKLTKEELRHTDQNATLEIDMDDVIKYSEVLNWSMHNKYLLSGNGKTRSSDNIILEISEKYINTIAKEDNAIPNRKMMINALKKIVTENLRDEMIDSKIGYFPQLTEMEEQIVEGIKNILSLKTQNIGQ